MAMAMSAASLLAQRGVDTIECWDEDPAFAEIDQIPHHVARPYSRASTDRHRRESVSSSRMSITSGYEIDSPDGGEHEVALDDSPASAIASAMRAGIPIPESVPSSALIGGTIQRLGTNKRGRRGATHEDWGEDLPELGISLAVRKREYPGSNVFDSLRSRSPSPTRLGAINVPPIANAQLARFRDDSEDSDIFADCDELPTLKIPSCNNTPSPQLRKMGKPLLLTPPLSETAAKDTRPIDDDFENDFDFPADGPLQLNLKPGGRPQQHQHGMEPGFEDWGEADSGFAGSTYGVIRGPSEIRPTSSAIASPSISGMTLESEDEPLDGLILPEGALPDLGSVLKKRQLAAARRPCDGSEFHVQKDLDDTNDDEFFDGIEIGEGEVFDAKKLTLNRNVKQKNPPRKRSPVRRTATSLKFTKRTGSTQPPPPPRSTRLSQGHPSLLPPLQVLEPVVERENQQETQKRHPRNRWSSGAAISDRWSGADNYNSSLATNKSRVEKDKTAAKKPSSRNARPENVRPTTTSAQLLRAKRSMPNMAKTSTAQTKPSRPPPPPPLPPPRVSSARPPSRSSGTRPQSTNSSGRPTSSGSRPPSSSGRPASRSSTGRPGSRTEARPKTPHSTLKSFRHPAPFIPGGASVQTSHHAVAKASRQTERQVDLDRRPTSRLTQRTTPRHSPSSSWASTATKRGTPTLAPEQLRREAANIEMLTQPTRKRNFGDGTELEVFDDLPTSTRLETRYTVTPAGHGAPKVALRPKSSALRDREGESPKKKMSTRAPGDVPRFARDTASSRNAREYTQQRLAMSTPVPSSPTADRWRAHINTRSQITPKNRKKSYASMSQQKPHLIKPMGSINTLPKENAANGMTYNPRTMRWDGNERELQAFEPTQNRTPQRQPALIAKVNQSGSKVGIQVVGGMVFDPSRMCWLKVDEDPEDEGDPFEGVDDVPDDLMSVDNQSLAGVPGGNNSIIMGGTSSFGGVGGPPRLSSGFGEFVVGEEFDVGPMFVNRQRQEEDGWRRVVDGWICPESAARPENRYFLRDLLLISSR